MITSRGAYERTMQPIQSSNGTAIYAGNPLWAVDCIPSSIVACQWPTGGQTTSVYVHVPWRLTPAPTMECRLFALLGLQDIPIGVRVDLYGGATANPGTFLTTTQTVLMPDGTIAALVVRDPGDGWVHEYFAWRIFNDDGTGTFIAAGADFGIGEVWATPAWDWPVGNWSTKLVLPHLLNRMSSGAAKKVLRDPYRTVELTITPQDWQTAMVGPDTLLAMLYDLAGQECVLLVPRPELRGGSGADPAIVPVTAILADLVDAGPLASDAPTDRYPLTLSFEEFL